MTSNRPYLLRAIHDWINDNGLTPHLLVDASVAGVRVPPSAIKDGRVVLSVAPRAVARFHINPPKKAGASCAMAANDSRPIEASAPDCPSVR